MKTSISILIGPPPPGIESHLDTCERYRELVDFCSENALCKDIPADLDKPGVEFYANFNDNEFDPRLNAVLSMLKDIGREPFPRIVPKGSGAGAFPWTIVRSYTKRDLDQFEYFSIYYWASKRGSDLAAEISFGPKFSGLKAGGFNAQNFKFPFLTVDQIGHLVVNEVGKTILMDSGLGGLVFEKIKWIDPENSKGDCYVVTSSVLMPPCLTPLVEDEDGYFVFVDGPNYPPILRFDKSKMERVKGIDYLLTSEKISGEKALGGRVAVKVISRSFRDLLIRNKVYIEVAPVVLI